MSWYGTSYGHSWDNSAYDIMNEYHNNGDDDDDVSYSHKTRSSTSKKSRRKKKTSKKKKSYEKKNDVETTAYAFDGKINKQIVDDCSACNSCDCCDMSCIGEVALNVLKFATILVLIWVLIIYLKQ